MLAAKTLTEFTNLFSPINFMEEKGMSKYLIFDSTEENKELVKKIQLCLEWHQKQNRRSNERQV